jgi:hypothetical protein
MTRTPDVFLDPRFEWTASLPATAFAGERSWMPTQAVAAEGFVVLGARTTSVGLDAAWDSFRTEMVQRGWVSPDTAPAPGDVSFAATLSYDERRCAVILYTGATHGSSADSGRGTRAEIVGWAERP